METYRKQVAAHHILKAMAIFSMIITHSWSLSVTDTEYEMYANHLGIRIAEAVTIFLFWGLWIPALAGAGLRFRLGSSPRSKSVLLESLKIGNWLLVFGVITSLGSEVFRVTKFWNPPLFLAACFCIFFLLNKFLPNTYVIVSFIFFTLLEIFFDRGWVPTLLLGKGEFLFNQVLLGVSGEWSLSPWLLAFIFGYHLVHQLQSKETTKKSSLFARGLFLAIAGLTLLSPESLSFLKKPLLIRNEKIPFLVFLGVHSLLAFTFFQLIESSKIERWGKIQLVRCLSCGSLYIFIFHLLALYLMLPFFQDLSVPLRLVLMPLALFGWALFFGQCADFLKQRKLSVTLVKKNRTAID